MAISTSATTVDTTLTNTAPVKIIVTSAGFNSGDAVTIANYAGKTAVIVGVARDDNDNSTAAAVSGNTITLGTSPATTYAIMSCIYTYRDV